jgi:hypothetical protein
VQAVGEPALYRVRWLERLEFGTSYPAVVSRMLALMRAADLRGAPLVVGVTGVGGPVLDMIAAAGLSPSVITISGGNSVTSEAGHFRVPKRDLVSRVQVFLQLGRLKIAEALPAAELLVQELCSFQVRISFAGRDTDGAANDWREDAHDDLVLAVGLACWWGEHAPGRGWLRLMERGLVFNPAGLTGWRGAVREDTRGMALCSCYPSTISTRRSDKCSRAAGSPTLRSSP